MKVQTLYGPPGTGKTTSLVDIAERELVAGNAVTYMSYSKAAAIEATSRLQGDAGLGVSTIHAMAFKIMSLGRGQVVDKFQLKKFGQLVGIPFSGAEANTEEEQQEGDEYMACISYAKNTTLFPHEAYELAGSPGTRDRFEMFVESYAEWKDKNGLIDFDDMLIKSCTMVKAGRNVPKLEVAIIDEAQDCTPLQWHLLRLITPGAKRVYVAGDDDQAIFEWNGADPHGMAKFTDDHGGKSRVLDQSYRVPRSVYGKSMDIIDNVKKRVDKKFKPRDAEGLVLECDSTDDVISKWTSKNESSMMFLARDRFQLKETRDALDEAMIPYVANGGFSKWTSKEANAIRAINCFNNDEQPTPELMKALRELARPGMDSYKGDWLKILQIEPWKRRFYEDAGDLLYQPIRTKVSTIHQAKGQEADVVVLDLRMSARGLREIYKGDNARDAEYRVWYVGATRAKNELYLCGENPLI